MNIMQLRKTLVAITVLMMLGLVSAASQDVPNAGHTPGDAFYFMDRFSESLELTVAKAPVIGSSELEAKVRANHAAERLSEAQKLAERNESDKVESLMAEYSKQINRSVESAKKANNTNLSKRLGNVSNNHVKVLQDVQQKVPEQAKKGIQKAIENSQKNQKELRLPEQAQNRGKTMDLTGPQVNPDKPVNKTVGRTKQISNKSNVLDKTIQDNTDSSKTGDTVENITEENEDNLENTTDNESLITGKAIKKPTKPELP